MNLNDNDKIKILEKLNYQLSSENEKLKKQLEDMNRKLKETMSHTQELVDNLNFSKGEYERLINGIKKEIADFHIHKELYTKLKK